ncbi:MAG: 5'/3'-nucleotidase SurE [Caldilineaceae bacterium]
MVDRRPVILVSNDDGIHAPGLLALVQALRSLGTVVAVAPERNWSASGHNKTMHDPLRLTPVHLADGSDAWACSGGPADSVAIALLGGLEQKIDLVVSGINNGHNMGNDISYSGTVACAREATMMGVPGIAVSTALQPLAKVELEVARAVAGDVARLVAQAVLANGLPAGTLLNVNVPAVLPQSLRGIEITRLGVRKYDDKLMRREDPFGRPYYWIAAPLPNDLPDDGTDVGAVANDIVSVTPIGLDMTQYSFQSALRAWALEGALDAVTRFAPLPATEG